ncbi:lipid-binding SYLF domain-containing protein [Marinibaculum pumilum]|uniref:Lipid-binding SYLF domain-containing protein n=1 Tax=Marinibaculum pumilum TaxID=1766165 RepID=A0ABV7L4L5_9PROT
MNGRIRSLGASVALAALLAGGPALAAGDTTTADAKVETRTTVITTKKAEPAVPEQQGAAITDELEDAEETVRGAKAAIAKMKGNAELTGLMQRAKGIYIVPEFAKGAIVVGGWGGEGVLLTRNGSGWSGPAFYDIAAVSAGAEIGFTSGTVAYLLLSDSALDEFRTDESFSLGANAELTVVDFSAQAKATLGDKDIVVWSDTEGAYVGAGGSVSDINWDAEANNAYYRKDVTVRQILNGEVQSPNMSLQDALSG